MEGYRLLYTQKFPEARRIFTDWAAEYPNEPLGQISIAASYLFEEFYRQGVLTSDFFLDNKKFLKGIDGKPDPERMKGFLDALARARSISEKRLKDNENDPEALYALTLADGMESNANSILFKKSLDALKRMKDANQEAKSLLAVRPGAMDVYVALGSANYIIGSLSFGYRFALWFGDIHGDKKLGMEQVAKTADGGRYLRPFAKIMLALAAEREKQPVLAQKLLRELTEEFPESPLFAAEYAKVMHRPIPSELRPAS